METKCQMTKEKGIYCHIVNLATHPDYLKRGLATKLIVDQEELSKKNGFKVYIAESYSTIS